MDISSLPVVSGGFPSPAIFIWRMLTSPQLLCILGIFLEKNGVASHVPRTQFGATGPG